MWIDPGRSQASGKMVWHQRESRLAAVLRSWHLLAPFGSGFGFSLSAWPGGTASALRHPPARIIPGDPDFAQSIYANRKTAAEIANYAELGFARHFAASGKSLHAIYAAGLFAGWALRECPRLRGAAAARTLLNLSYDVAPIAAKIRSLETVLWPAVTTISKRVFAWHPTSPEDRLLRAAALMAAGLAFRGLQGLQPHANPEFEVVLPQIVLADGGHSSGAPENLLRLLLMLVPLRQAAFAARDFVPSALHHAIERAYAMLHMLSLGDGGLSALRCDRQHREVVAALRLQDTTQGNFPALAIESGLVRVQHGKLCVFADAHSRSLKSEVSHGDNRLLIMELVQALPHKDMALELVRAEGGSLLQNSATVDIFIAADGEDLRVETAADQRLQFGEDATLEFDSAEDLRLSFADQSHWVLSQRGGTLVRTSATQFTLQIKGGSRANWALRKIRAT
jgi:hypothetical protein